MITGKSIRIEWVEVSVIAHATEDEAKVERAVKNIIPDSASDIMFKQQPLSGYHKDPIQLITARIKKKHALEFLRAFIKNLNVIDQYQLLDELEGRLDKAGNFYVRLDKQKAFRGLYSLKEEDSIRLKFRFYIPHNTEASVYVRNIIEVMMKNGEEDRR